MDKVIEIFAAGKHVAEDGNVYEFSEADLQACAAAYDAGKHEAPLVIGHPKSNAPAYGWVKSLAHVGGLLVAAPQQVEPQFAEMVQAGRFKKRSASFYGPEHPANPVPGVWYLRHVGFLGAQPPGVKGLRDAQFADAEAGVINFADWSDQDNASLWRRFREWLIGKFGLEEADKAVPDYLVNSLQSEAAVDLAKGSDAVASYAESQRKEQDMQTAAELAAREQKLKQDQEALAVQQAQFAERENQVKAAEAAQRRAGLAQFVEGLVTEGRVLPAHKDGLVALLAGMDAAVVVEFGEGAAKVSKPSVEWLQDYLKAQPKVVDFQERGAGGAEAVDLGDADAIAAKALEFQEAERKAGRVISISQAVTHITKGAQK